MRPSDLDYMRQLRPPAIRVFEPDGNKMQLAHSASPDSLLFPRDHSQSEQHDDVRSNPQGTGQRHAREWRAKLDSWRAAGHSLPPDKRIVVVAQNEPHVWDMLAQTVEYNVAWLDECTRLGLRACALNLSVGWPANDAPGEPPNWKPYAPVEAAIKRGNGAHYLCVHEYFYKSGPQDNWGWWAGRIQHCPWDVPIIIGECGIDMFVDIPRWEADGRPKRGWVDNVSANVYANQLQDYARMLDTRIEAILPFLLDVYDNRWSAFDVEGAIPQLLAASGGMVPQAAPPGGKPPKPEPPRPEPPIGETPPPFPVGNAPLWPAHGPVTQRWGERPEFYQQALGIPAHNGTDIGVAIGSPVVAPADGIVKWVDTDPEGYGLYCRLYLPAFRVHVFMAHLDSCLVQAGDVVKRGQVIAHSGNSGLSDGPHLHCETRLGTEHGYVAGTFGHGNGRVDPQAVFWLLGGVQEPMEGPAE
jgi:murein DD-endopeptidase MepM/ murein hydrolase activator NlpD